MKQCGSKRHNNGKRPRGHFLRSFQARASKRPLEKTIVRHTVREEKRPGRRRTTVAAGQQKQRQWQQQQQQPHKAKSQANQSLKASENKCIGNGSVCVYVRGASGQNGTCPANQVEIGHGDIALISNLVAVAVESMRERKKETWSVCKSSVTEH